MILHLCDYCGRETDRGAHIRPQSVTTEIDLTKKWRNGHTTTRHSRVALLVGIDGTDLTPIGQEIPGHDLCDACLVSILRVLLERYEDGAR